MSVIENYLTAISFIIVLRSFWILIELIHRKRKKGVKKMFHYIVTSFSSNDVLILKLSLLWLVVFYFSYILLYTNELYLFVCTI